MTSPVSRLIFASIAVNGGDSCPWLIYSVQLVRVLFPEPDFRYVDGYPIRIPVVMTLAAIVIALLWGMGSLVEKVRRDIFAEAAGRAT